MKKLQWLLMTVAIATIISCEKNSNANNNNTPTPTPNGSGFKWTTNGTTTENISDSAFYRTQFKTIFAYKKINSVMKLQYEINLTAGTPATYTLGNGNAITYTANTPFFAPSSGSVIVSANSGTKLTGTFSGTGTATAGTSAVNGSFTDIPIQ